LLTVIACPECDAPAEVTERFCLPGTDGPVQHVALSCAAGHQVRIAADRLPAPAREQLAGRDTGTKPRSGHHLCIHCMTNPAGFWVSRRGSQVVRRPWCLTCCQGLDPDLYDIVRFDAPKEPSRAEASSRWPARMNVLARWVRRGVPGRSGL